MSSNHANSVSPSSRSRRLSAAITAVSAFVPPGVLTNKDLESIVETSDEWIRIRNRTGVERRHIRRGEGKGTSEMGAAAVVLLCKKRGIRASEIDLIICATVTPDHVFPATANIISDKVGATNAWSFDVGAACSGFLFALVTGAQFVETGKYSKVVVVGADKISSIVDYSDRATCCIFRDGAGAVLLEPNFDGLGIIDSVLHSDGAGRVHLNQKAGGSIKPASELTVRNREHLNYQEGPRRLQGSGPANGGSVDFRDEEERLVIRGPFGVCATSGNSSDYRRDIQSHRHRPWEGDDQHPAVRKHYVGHHSPVPRGFGIEAAMWRPAGFCGIRWWVYLGGDVPEMGLQRSSG